MAYIDTTYVDAMIGTATRQHLFDDDDGQGFVQSRFDQVELAARASVDEALGNSGHAYALGSGAPEIVKLATFGRLLVIAYGRKNIGDQIPEAYKDAVDLCKKIRDGEVQVHSLAVSDVGAVGGYAVTDTTRDVDGAKPKIFGRDPLSGY